MLHGSNWNSNQLLGPLEGTISLALEVCADKFVIRVSDSGIGIPDSEKDAVAYFEAATKEEPACRTAFENRRLRGREAYPGRDFKSAGGVREFLTVFTDVINHTRIKNILDSGCASHRRL